MLDLFFAQEPSPWRSIVPALIVMLAWGAVAQAQTPPVTGERTPGVEAFDRILLDTMKRVDASAATLAVLRNGTVIHRRAYGYADVETMTPATPDHLFRVASNSKPITRAIVRQIIDEGGLAWETKIVPFLGIEPFKNVWRDERHHEITVRHLMDHRGGWDVAVHPDPMYSLPQIQKTLQIEREITIDDVISYMFSRRLIHTPGEKEAYSNFGYAILGRMVEKATGRSFAENVRTRIAEPLGVAITVSHEDRARRDPREVVCPRDEGLPMEIRAASGGLVATAEAMARFLEAYLITGERRRPGESWHYIHFGSLPHTTLAVMEQRPDGLVYAVMVGGRRNLNVREDLDALRAAIVAALDASESDHRK